MTEPARCLHCGYVLWGLPAGICPECGFSFDPDNPSTYSTKPLFDRWKYWLPGFLLASIGGGFLCIVLILLGGWGMAVSIAAPFAIGATVGYGCRVRIFLRVLLSLAALAAVVCMLFSMSLVGLFCGAVLAIVATLAVTHRHRHWPLAAHLPQGNQV